MKLFITVLTLSAPLLNFASETLSKDLEQDENKFTLCQDALVHAVQSEKNLENHVAIDTSELKNDQESLLDEQKPDETCQACLDCEKEIQQEVSTLGEAVEVNFEVASEECPSIVEDQAPASSESQSVNNSALWQKISEGFAAIDKEDYLLAGQIFQETTSSSFANLNEDNILCAVASSLGVLFTTDRVGITDEFYTQVGKGFFSSLNYVLESLASSQEDREDLEMSVEIADKLKMKPEQLIEMNSQMKDGEIKKLISILLSM
jgi:hypothetical protein